MGAFNNIAALAGGFMDESDKKRKETFETDRERRKQALGLISELITRPDVSEETKGWLTQKGFEIGTKPKWKFDLSEAPTRPQRKATVPAEQMQVGNASLTIPPVNVQEPPPPPGSIFMGQQQQDERSMDRLRTFGVDTSKLDNRDRARVAGVNLPAGRPMQRVALANGQWGNYDPETGTFTDSSGQVIADPRTQGTIDETVVQDGKSSTGWVKVYTDKNTLKETGRVEVPAPAAYLPRSSTGVTIAYDANNNPVPITTTRTSGVSMPKPPPSGTVGTSGGAPKTQTQGGGGGRVSVGEPLNFTRFNAQMSQQRRSLGAVRTQFNNLEKLITDYQAALKAGDTKKAVNTGTRMNRMAGSLAVSYGKALGEVGNFAQQEQEKYQKAFYAGFPVVTAESLLDLDTNIAQDTLNDARSVLDSMEAQMPEQTAVRRKGDGRIVEPPKPPSGASTKGKDFGAAPAGSTEGRKGKLSDGTLIIVQGGRLVGQ